MVNKHRDHSITRMNRIGLNSSRQRPRPVAHVTGCRQLACLALVAGMSPPRCHCARRAFSAFALAARMRSGRIRLTLCAQRSGRQPLVSARENGAAVRRTLAGRASTRSSRRTQPHNGPRAQLGGPSNCNCTFVITTTGGAHTLDAR